MSKQPTHTPGPWYASGDIQPQIASESDASGRTLALVYDYNATETGPNARLIAAAPELLRKGDKLLTTLRAYADYWQNNPGEYGDILGDMDGMEKAIIDAID